MKNLTIAICILFASHSICISQIDIDPDKIKLFDDLKAIPINRIVQDKEGIIWLAGWSGHILKFDGYDHSRIFSDSMSNISYGGRNLYRDQDDYLWIGGAGIGSQDRILVKYNPIDKSITEYPFDDLINYSSRELVIIFSAADNGHGKVFFGVNGQNKEIDGSNALFYFDKNSISVKKFNHPFEDVRRITSRFDGNIWLTDRNGFHKIDNNDKVSTIDTPWLADNESIKLLEIDSQGIIWIVTDRNRLLSFKPESNEAISFETMKIRSEAVVINDLIFDSDQLLWLASNRGLINMDPTNGNYKSLEIERLTSLAFDSFGNLWTGTNNRGLYRYNRNSLFNNWIHQYNPEAITSGAIYKIFVGSQDMVWICSTTSSGGRFSGTYGLNKYNPRTNTMTPDLLASLSPDYKNIAVAGELNANQILLRTNRGWKIFDANRNMIAETDFSGIELDNRIRKIVHDSYQNIWFCTQEGLFLKKKGTQNLKFLDLSVGKYCNERSNIVNNVFESTKRGLWIWTENGLFHYDYENEKIQSIAMDEEKGDVLPSFDINSVYEDKNGNLWIGAWFGGLSKYNPVTGEIKTYSTNHGLSFSGVQGVLGDEENDAIWVSTSGGISRFNINEERFNNFGPEDGLSGFFYFELSSAKASNGMLFFGGNRGVTYFDPKDFVKLNPPPSVYIENFKIANQSYVNPQLLLSDEKINLTHDQNNFSFEYTGIHYTNPSKNQFSYQLVNYDNTWREVDNLRSAFYYNVPPGDYTFQVKAANSNGIWSEPVSLDLTIKPPWWFTWWAYSFYGLLLVAGVIVVDRVQRKRLVAKERERAREKELEQAKEIEKAYTELKSTQSQLIQSEKMASLGELTAGIAHEIQNPLNFVNNFSEVNSELVEELRQELDKGDLDEARTIAKDIEENEQKIKHHGQRAESIVKGMLQHSRTNSGEKMLIDINKLADEYLRLAYHGMRAKDKSFNAELKTDFDPDLPLVSVVPQDIGRVLLNLINNAFYAVSEASAKESAVSSEAALSSSKGAKEDRGHKPLVVVSTRREDSPLGAGGSVEITVMDNGTGIPGNVKEKIFQPFFSTKPTGEGTGLGLSLSYDIITKGHGGSIIVESEKGQGTTFIIKIPLKS